jgi:hypothetical protein
MRRGRLLFIVAVLLVAVLVLTRSCRPRRPALRVIEGGPGAVAPPWVEPDSSGECPPSHPVKVKLRSGIFHEPGSANYDRTRPDRCYTSGAAAEADGFRRSQT